MVPPSSHALQALAHFLLPCLCHPKPLLCLSSDGAMANFSLSLPPPLQNNLWHSEIYPTCTLERCIEALCTCTPPHPNQLTSRHTQQTITGLVLSLRAIPFSSCPGDVRHRHDCHSLLVADFVLTGITGGTTIKCAEEQVSGSVGCQGGGRYCLARQVTHLPSATGKDIAASRKSQERKHTLGTYR